MSGSVQPHGGPHSSRHPSSAGYKRQRARQKQSTCCNTCGNIGHFKSVCPYQVVYNRKGLQVRNNHGNQAAARDPPRYQPSNLQYGGDHIEPHHLNVVNQKTTLPISQQLLNCQELFEVGGLHKTQALLRSASTTGRWVFLGYAGSRYESHLDGGKISSQTQLDVGEVILVQDTKFINGEEVVVHAICPRVYSCQIMVEQLLETSVSFKMPPEALLDSKLSQTGLPIDEFKVKATPLITRIKSYSGEDVKWFEKEKFGLILKPGSVVTADIQCMSLPVGFFNDDTTSSGQTGTAERMIRWIVKNIYLPDTTFFDLCGIFQSRSDVVFRDKILITRWVVFKEYRICPAVEELLLLQNRNKSIPPNAISIPNFATEVAEPELPLINGTRVKIRLEQHQVINYTKYCGNAGDTQLYLSPSVIQVIPPKECLKRGSSTQFREYTEEETRPVSNIEECIPVNGVLTRMQRGLSPWASQQENQVRGDSENEYAAMIREMNESKELLELEESMLQWKMQTQEDLPEGLPFRAGVDHQGWSVNDCRQWEFTVPGRSISWCIRGGETLLEFKNIPIETCEFIEGTTICISTTMDLKVFRDCGSDWALLEKLPKPTVFLAFVKQVTLCSEYNTVTIQLELHSELAHKFMLYIAPNALQETFRFNVREMQLRPGCLDHATEKLHKNIEKGQQNGDVDTKESENTKQSGDLHSMVRPKMALMMAVTQLAANVETPVGDSNYDQQFGDNVSSEYAIRLIMATLNEELWVFTDELQELTIPCVRKVLETLTEKSKCGHALPGASAAQVNDEVTESDELSTGHGDPWLQLTSNPQWMQLIEAFRIFETPGIRRPNKNLARKMTFADQYQWWREAIEEFQNKLLLPRVTITEDDKCSLIAVDVYDQVIKVDLPRYVTTCLTKMYNRNRNTAQSVAFGADAPQPTSQPTVDGQQQVTCQGLPAKSITKATNSVPVIGTTASSLQPHAIAAEGSSEEGPIMQHLQLMADPATQHQQQSKNEHALKDGNRAEMDPRMGVQIPKVTAGLSGDHSLETGEGATSTPCTSHRQPRTDIGQSNLIRQWTHCNSKSNERSKGDQ